MSFIKNYKSYKFLIMNIFQKKINLFRLLLGFVLLGTFSCVEEDLGSFKPKDPNMTFGDADTIFVSKEASEHKVMLTSNLPWRVKVDVDWVTLDTLRGLTSDSVAFSIAKNNTTVARTARLTAWITSEYENVIIIKQEAGDPLPDVWKNYYVKTTGSATNDGLSWDSPITLDKALELSLSNDRIHIAAGTYKPATTITGGSTSNASDQTFEIKNNVIITGGYPADAKTGDQPDATANPTILSGNLSAFNAYHVVTITAPLEENRKVEFNNINITQGKAAPSGTAAISINGISYPRLNGGAMVIGKAVAQFNNCRIYENQADYHTPGIYIFSGAKVTFNSCSIDHNKGLSASGANGGAIWNDASTVYLINSSVSSNENSGVGGGIYAYHASLPSKTYLFNTTLDNNSSSHKAGYYGRENSQAIFVNCTVYGNTSKHATSSGAGICVYANATTTRTDIISTTITNNISQGTADASGGIRINDGNCTVNIHNSIVSGNIGAGVIGDIYTGTNATYSKSYSIISEKVYDGSGTEVAGKTFDPATMLAPLAKNGNAYSCLLIGENNPATTMGMSVAQLLAVGLGFDPVIEEGIITYDQLGLNRSGKTVIGACVK